MKTSKLTLAAAAMGMLLLILDSRTASRAASLGIELCIRTVIPSLFPFFLLSGYLTGNVSGGTWIAKIFRCPGACGTVLLTGFLGGYPIGARLAAQEYHAGRLPKAQADRLLMFCSQAGPSFLFGITAAQLRDLRLTWLLWAVILLSALSVAWLIPGQVETTPRKTQGKKLSMTEAMGNSLRAMASVCGWVVIFSVLMAFLKRWFLWLLPENIQVLLCGMLELTNGCLMLSSVNDPRLRFWIAALILSFGGLSVWMQTASVAKGLSLSRYFLGKILQTAFTGLYALAFMGYPIALLPVFLLFSAKKLLKSRKNSSIPVEIGV